MATLTRRLQVLLDEQRFARLSDTARRRGTTVAALVRDAIDDAYPADGHTPDEAAERLLARPALDLDTWDDAKRHIEDSFGRDAPA